MFPTALLNDTQVAVKKGSRVADSEGFLKHTVEIGLHLAKS